MPLCLNINIYNNIPNFSSNNNIKQKLIKYLTREFFSKVIGFKIKLK